MTIYDLRFTIHEQSSVHQATATSLTIRVKLSSRAGTLGEVATAINNVLCFPGIFRGALACRARTINEEMKLGAANAIANIITPAELHPEDIIPSVLDKRVAEAVAHAVEAAAYATHVARRDRAAQEGM